MRIFVAAMVMMMGLSVQAHAAFYDGNRLNEACQSEQNHGDGICQFIDMMHQILAKRKARLTPCLFQSLILVPVFALPKPGFGNLF